MLEKAKSSLKRSGAWSAQLESRLNEFEALCLCEIHSEALRNAVHDYLENVAPVQFFTAPASSSGKNHPSWQSCAGGIIVNTTECCIGIERKMRMYAALIDDKGNPKEPERDIIYAATILSDIFKTEDAGKHWKQFSHHRSAAQHWHEVANRHHVPGVIAEAIEEAILWHLGRFTPEWPEGKDVRDLPLCAFITHELDMDFSNRRLAEVFRRKGVDEGGGEQAEAFLQKEFETAAHYIEHVESKLSNVITFYATLLIAFISGSYYIAVSDMFRSMRFWIIATPRAFFIGLAAVVFFAIGIFFVGMYAELRVRKIRMVEEMAAIRQYYIGDARRSGKDISSAITMVSDIGACPPFLRRPSEDWYTILLMSFVNACAFALAVTFGVFVAVPNWIKFHAAPKVVLVLVGVLLFWVVARLQFRWVTLFCYELDCRREVKYGVSTYEFMPKHGSSFPLYLKRLDKLADNLEKENKSQIMQRLCERDAEATSTKAESGSAIRGGKP